MKALIENKDYEGIRRSLANNPELANEGITIPFDNKCTTSAHPLHRICDAVFAKKITDEEAIEIAKIFLSNGANINGSVLKIHEDTPLLAAASLHAEQLGMFYIDHGADIDYADRQDGASALHWAAYCGREKLVEKLIQKNAAIDRRDKSHDSTPLGWAIYPLITGDKTNKHHQVSCIKLLLRSGANINMLDQEKIQYLHHLAEADSELKNMLN
ncbi:MAG TPA: ankyrin repeat domain-containing protein [Chitinophagaceae bacterium]|nr:ankyrin repeat domain-containing protein [Chitinophagaceae bacterium]